jgi:hypothetical protein
MIAMAEVKGVSGYAQQGRQGDRETGRQGDREIERQANEEPRPAFSLSPCLPVSLSAAAEEGGEP